MGYPTTTLVVQDCWVSGHRTTDCNTATETVDAYSVGSDRPQRVFIDLKAMAASLRGITVVSASLNYFITAGTSTDPAGEDAMEVKFIDVSAEGGRILDTALSSWRLIDGSNTWSTYGGVFLSWPTTSFLRSDDTMGAWSSYDITRGLQRLIDRATPGDSAGTIAVGLCIKFTAEANDYGDSHYWKADSQVHTTSWLRPYISLVYKRGSHRTRPVGGRIGRLICGGKTKATLSRG